MTTNRMETHLTAVAALHVGTSLIGFAAGGFIFLVVGLPGLLSGDLTAMTATTLVGALIAGFLYAVSLPGLVGGIALWKRKKWARPLLLIVSVLDLFNVPVGTAVAVYTFWVLLQDETSELLGAGVLPRATGRGRAAERPV